MATITAALVKELRDSTGAGMMDCKKALTETDGDMEAAVTFLREKGLAAAAKKAGRIAAEGMVQTHVDGSIAGMVEVNCETDFVAKTDEFKELAANLAQTVAEKAPGKVKVDDDGEGEALYAQAYGTESGKTVGDVVTEKVAKIGENIGVRRLLRLEGGDLYGQYIHAGGKIGVLVELGLEDKSKAGETAVQTLAKDLAMHVAAANPLFLKQDEADADTVEKEKAIFRQQALDEGKPEKIVDNIVNGRIKKFFREACLLEQAYVKDPDINVEKLLGNVGSDVGTTITLNRFARYMVGEGVEKKSEDFAEEVAKMAGG
jgi:elongation factor Ts